MVVDYAQSAFYSPVVCTYCGKTYINEVYLSEHVKTEHPGLKTLLGK